MLKKSLQKIHKGRLDRLLNRPYLLLSEEDIEKLRNGGSISFELDEYVADIIVKYEKSYENMLHDVKPYKED